MDFDKKAYCQLKKWWDYHGNPNVRIWTDDFDNIYFGDRTVHRLVAKITLFGSRGWAFERSWKNYPIAEDEQKQIAEFVKCCNNKQPSNARDARDEQTFTYSKFFKQFNELSDGYHAEPSSRGGVDIVDKRGDLKASLLPHTDGWYFTESGFPGEELLLMARLATTLPERRGKI